MNTTGKKSAIRRAMRVMLRDMRVPLPNVAPPVIAWLRGQPALRRIAVFAPLPGEPDLLPLLSVLPDRTWCFPRVVDADQLAFHAVKDPALSLRPATLGILEPIPETPGISIARIDAFICPGLAFDRTGGRLGRGRGYYDRMLSEARPDAVKVGACFACQLVDSTFPESHDIPMDIVICESGPATPEA